MALVATHVHGLRSLKQKRGAVRSVLQRVRVRFQSSASWAGGLDMRWPTVPGIAAIKDDAEQIYTILNRAIGCTEELCLAEFRASAPEV